MGVTSFSSRSFSFVATPLLLLMAVLPGCSDGPELIPVSGKVTVDGKPLAEGTVKFIPAQGGRSARSSITENGTYQLSSFKKGDGVPPGDYIVTIEAMKDLNEGKKAKSQELDPELTKYDFGGNIADVAESKIVYLVPEEYAFKERTPLKATVDAATTTHDFEVPAAK